MRVARFAIAAMAATMCPVSAVTVIATPVASAGTDPAVHDFGGQAMLVDGSVVQGWTINGLKKSSDTIPYDVQGTLWEATASDEALHDRAVPIVSNLNARTHNGHTYRALFQVATAEGVNPAALAPGEETTGKLYFDVTDEDPDSVVYNDGSQDRAVWAQPPPMPPAVVPTPLPSGSRATTNGTDAASPVAGIGTVPPPPSTQDAVLPAGRQGTPQLAASQGIPQPPGQQGSALPSASQGTPQLAASQGIPQPPGQQGSALPSASQGTPQLAASQGIPQPPGQQGSALPPASQGTPQLAASQGIPQPPGQQGSALPSAKEGGPPPAQTSPVLGPADGEPAAGFEN